MKLSKILSIAMVAIMLVCASTSVYASTVNLEQLNKNTANSAAVGAMQTIGGNIIGLITNAGMILAVVLVAFLGIKYMLGSAEEKAEYKKSMMPLLVGAVLVFGASTIAKIVIGIMG